MRVLGTMLLVSAGLIPGLDSAAAEEVERVIVRLEPDRAAALKEEIASHVPEAVVHRYENLPLLALDADAGLQAHLAAMDGVRGIEADVLLKPHLDVSVPLVEADGALTHPDFDGGAGVAVAILDTGVDANHPAFGGRVVEEACFSTSDTNRTGYCPNGQNTDSGPGSSRPCAGGSCPHGTHVAGIAAGNDGILRGVAPRADIIAVTVFSWWTGDCDGDGPRCLRAPTTDVLAGINFVIGLASQYDIAAINLSLGSGDFPDGCDDSGNTNSWTDTVAAARAVGIAVIASSGNEGLTDGIESPACRPGVVSVGNTTKADEVNDSSNSVAGLDLLAPGTNIGSWLPYSPAPFPMTGTSMAAPHVAGAFALMRHRLPWAGADTIELFLKSNGVPITDPRNGLVTPRLRLPYPPREPISDADLAIVFEEWAYATLLPYLDPEAVMERIEVLREFIMANLPCHEVGYMPGAGCP